MNSGALDRYIVIQSASVAKDSYGEDVETWATFLEAFAMIVRGRGGEKYEQGRETQTNIKIFKIRYFAGILADMRILYDSGYYYITNVDEAGREGLIITAEKRL